jgi:ABC-2 type transport system permease protein
MFILWRVIVKELLQLRQDKRIIPVIFFAPIIQITVFGFAVNTDVKDVPMVLVDQDHTAQSRALVDRFVHSGYFEVVGMVETTSEAEPWLVSGDASVVLVIQAGYAAARRPGRVAKVQVLADGTDSGAATVALGYAARIVSEAGAQRIILRLRQDPRLARALGPEMPGIELVPRVFYNPDLLSRWFYVPAVLAMILMVMTMLLTAMGVVREKEIGTMEQIIVTPIRPWQLIIGKLAPFAAIGMIQVFLVTGVTVFGFGVPLAGSFLLLLALTSLFLLNTLGLGLLISTLVDTQQQAMMTATFLAMVPMIYLSGLIFPIENMPAAIQVVTYGIPLRYYATIIRGVFLKGSGLDALWPQATILGAMGIGILSLAVLRFRKRLD